MIKNKKRLFDKKPRWFLKGGYMTRVFEKLKWTSKHGLRYRKKINDSWKIGEAFRVAVEAAKCESGFKNHRKKTCRK